MESQTQFLIERIKAWAASDENVVALLMTGSHARPEANVDDYSDLDLEVIAEHPRELADADTWLKSFGKIMVSHSLTQDQGYPTRLIFYESGLKVDFTIADMRRLTDMIESRRLDSLFERGYAVLLDKRGVTNDLPSSSGRFPIVSLPSQEEFSAVVEEFWFEAAHIPRYLLRGELWVVKVRDRTMKDLLLNMLEWRAIAAGEAPVDVWHIGSHMREWVDPMTWEELRGVFSRFDVRDSWRGLVATTTLFQRVAKETAERGGLDHPEVDEEVIRYIESFHGWIEVGPGRPSPSEGD